MGMTRKEFLKATAAVVTGTLALEACGDDESTTPAGPTSTATTSGGGSSTSTTSTTTTTTTTSSSTGGGNTCMGTIATNHGHDVTVPDADVIAGAEKTYDIMGSSPHSHQFTLTTGDMTTLQGGAPVTVTSTTSGTHTHGVTVSCMLGGGGGGGTGGTGGAGGAGGAGGN
jgi:hypothetical protein